MISALKLFVSLGVLATGLQAFAIGRVGTAQVGDTQDGFVAQVPRKFHLIKELAGSGVRLETLPKFRFSPLPAMNDRMDLMALREEFAELKGLSRTEFAMHFKELGTKWSALASSNSCIEARTAANGQLRTTVVSWGAGKGYVVVSPNQRDADEAVAELINNTELQDGACSW